MRNLQYLAGIVDGEGSIFIKTSAFRVHSDCKNPSYSPRLQVKMTAESVLKLLQGTFGGTLYQEKRIYQSMNGFKSKKLMWVWQVSDLNAFSALKKLAPFLLVKKEQALNAIGLYQFKKSIRREKRRAYSPTEMERFKSFYLRGKELNA